MSTTETAEQQPDFEQHPEAFIKYRAEALSRLASYAARLHHAKQTQFVTGVEPEEQPFAKE